MIATNEELALLEKWKRKLCLQELPRRKQRL